MNIEFNPIWAMDGNHRKEQHFYKEIAIISLKSKDAAITCRFYKTKTYYFCCVWIENGNIIYANGSAKASSPDDALNFALKNCGIKMTPFYNKEEQNLLELAKAIFHEDEFICHVAHG